MLCEEFEGINLSETLSGSGVLCVGTHVKHPSPLKGILRDAPPAPPQKQKRACGQLRSQESLRAVFFSFATA